MTSKKLFPPLEDWEPTRNTLHLYSRVVGEVPRTHAEFHPKWWHIALQVEPDGFRTTTMNLPSGGHFWLKMDLRQHKTFLHTNEGAVDEFDHTAGLTGTEFGDLVLDAVARLGLSGDYNRDKFEDDQAGQYDPVAVESFFEALTSAHRILKDHRESLSGDLSPLNFWNHGFDLSFEWFGTRIETSEENGEIQEYSSQLNHGFYPGGDAYFYSNPWPFEEDQLLDRPLPPGASWHTEGWQGTIFPYEELVGDKNAEARLRSYLKAVFNIASPTLMAE